MELVKNKVYRAELLDYTSDGAAVARIGGIAVFVPGGAAGDQCDIRILKVRARMAYGRIERRIVDSKHRIAPACPYAGKCGGCCWQHIDYDEECRAKQKKIEDAMRRIGGVTLPMEAFVPAPQTSHYRNKAQYPVGTTPQGVVTGFYRAHSHDIVPVSRCLLQNEKADRLAALVRRWMDDDKVAAYDGKKGVIRHVYVRTGAASGQCQLCLVATTPQLPASEALVALVTQQEPSLVSIVVNVNRKPGNVILGKQYHTLWGQDYLEDTLCGNRFHLSPAAFYQVNHAQAEQLYARVLTDAALTGQETVVELYCGAGTITLALARHAAHVTGVEVVPEAVQNARENAARNGLTNVDFLTADAGQAAMLLAQQEVRPDVVVVDPPRKGLDETALAAIVALQPSRLVYVSCDPATLARDVKWLSAQGYGLVRYSGFDLFPRTAHVETVALLSLKAGTPDV